MNQLLEAGCVEVKEKLESKLVVEKLLLPKPRTLELAKEHLEEKENEEYIGEILVDNVEHTLEKPEISLSIVEEKPKKKRGRPKKKIQEKVDD